PDCKDTKAFVEAADLKGFQSLLRGCQIQLKAEGMDYSKVDYGFKWKNSLPFVFAQWPLGIKIGFICGLAVGSFFLMLLCIAACAA
ncbi:hypothetical protein GP486_008354, partial [Trichoglossum hirsutum]